MKTLVIAAAALFAATSAEACGFIGQPPCNQFGGFQPPPPPTTFNTFGNTTTVMTPGQPMTTINRFGNTSTINTPGQPMTTCTTFGTTTTCR
jgi:hypothetical protein